MSDRNQRTSNNSTPSESLSPPQSSTFINVPPQQAQQPRHLIRSIFKSSTVPTNTNNNSNEGNIENPSEQDILNGEFHNHTSSVNNYNNNNNNSKNIDNSVDDSEFLDMNHLQQEMEDDNIESNVATKKAKRSKRSLFTRFKTPVKTEPNENVENFKSEEMLGNRKDISNENMETDMVGGASLHGLSINVTPSLDSNNAVNGTVLDSSVLNSSNNIPNIPGNSVLEPDYAALFEKVGKRKNIVNPASYIRNKPKYKNEQSEVNSINGSNNSNSNTEKSSILNYNSSGSYSENIDPRNINSIQSNDSSLNNRNIRTDGGDSDSDLSTSLGSSNNTPSSLATASKRILGSKLMLKRKNSQTNINAAPPPQPPTTTIISKGVEVEVDLQSLDLPPTTQIFPTNIINSKNRTRGRKENKEADLVDLSKIYLCNYCSRRFKRQEHLKRHFRSLHTFEKPYDCSICNKKFSRSDNLNQHLKIHKQEEELAKQGIKTLENIKIESHDTL